jgi:hypothetical protein
MLHALTLFACSASSDKWLERPELNPRRILIADDKVDWARDLSFVLADEGFASRPRAMLAGPEIPVRTSKHPQSL